MIAKKNWTLITKIRDFGFLAVSAGGANPPCNVPPDC